MDSVKPKEQIPEKILIWAKSMRECFGNVKLKKGLPWPGGCSGNKPAK